ncbi:hypothetical protein ZIOFF_009561 [Zingiber officinale]|uniref:Uncharacterized protein n=1 Tax=Zingiber officinale TaxID=94328 RepID=A0A8J5HL47_ZINOF|nr:hypothetical protein ZIOFF_009561 [Zingiber officinale]
MASGRADDQIVPLDLCIREDHTLSQDPIDPRVSYSDLFERFEIKHLGEFSIPPLCHNLATTRIPLTSPTSSSSSLYLEACRRKHQGVPLGFGVVVATMAICFSPNVDKFPSQARKFSVAVGSQVSVEDPDVTWIDGEVLEVKASEIKISCSTGRILIWKMLLKLKWLDAIFCVFSDLEIFLVSIKG